VEFSWLVEIDRMAALAANPGIARHQFLAAVVDAISRGLDAPECLLFSSPAGVAELRLTHGSGSCFDALKGRAAVRPDERTVFGVCVTRGENILIHRSADPKIAPYLPLWLPAREQLGAFVLLPLGGGGQNQGLILAGWAEA